MSFVLASVGDTVEFQLPVFDVDGITPISGLLDAAFAKSIFNEGINDETDD